MLPFLVQDWTAYGRDPGGTRFVPHCAITKANVSQLKPAWTFRTGDLSNGSEGPSSAFECTPILVDGTLLVVSPFNQVFALDPDTGDRKWSYDPKIARKRPQAVMQLVCRGVSAWQDPATKKSRVFVATNDARLIALDLTTGRPVSTFGKAGTIDLRKGIADGRTSYGETSPPCIIGSKVVVGSCIADDFSVNMPPGTIRAFDARTGKLSWSWRPYNGGAANAWAPISANPKTGMVFVPTGSPSPDVYGGLRPGNNADADSITALRASDGKKIWSFQVVRHDLWNYDIPAQPILTEVNGRAVVVALTKMGHIFVLDQVTGKPVFGVEERKVPASDVPGEKASALQPFPLRPKPMSDTPFVPWGLDETSRRRVAARTKQLRNEGIFTPPSLKGTLIFPGFIGGSNWSGGSVNPETDTLFVNSNSFAGIATLIPRVEAKGLRGVAAQRGTPYATKLESFFGGAGLPANAPPWGQLHAYDLRTGALRWEVPLGVHSALRNNSDAKKWGSPNLGGSFATDTGLVFIAAAMDNTLRAFDARDGSVLWSAPLPAGGQATPMTYRSPKTGKTYVVQCAGGHHGLGTKEGDFVVAFKL